MTIYVSHVGESNLGTSDAQLAREEWIYVARERAEYGAKQLSSGVRLAGKMQDKATAH